jgi:5'-nucleotidase
MKVLLLPFLFLVLLSSCTFKKGGARNEITKGHYQLYSNPEAIETQEHSEKRIVIVGTNDWAGQILTTHGKMKSKVQNDIVDFEFGGADYFSSYLKVIRETYPNEVLLLDAGNSLQGTLLSNNFNADPVLKIFEYLNYDAMALGGSDFLFPIESKNDFEILSQFETRFTKSKTHVLTTNLYNIANSSPIKSETMGPYLIKEINGIKVGLLGLTSKNILSRLPKELFTGIYIDDMAKSIVEYSHILRKKGAQVIVAMAHTDIRCGHKIAQEKRLPREKVNFLPRKKKVCETDSELYKVLKNIPQHTVDAIVAGGHHEKVANFINGTPVIQSFGNGTAFSMIHLFYNEQKKELNRHKTKVFQPTRVCHQFFKQSQDCYEKDDSVNHDMKITSHFLGKEIRKDIEVTKLIAPYQVKANKVAGKIIGNLPKDFHHEMHLNSPFAGFVVDTLKKKLRTDVALIYSDTIQYGLKKGSLTYGELFEALPYENNILKVKILGRDLKELVLMSINNHMNIQAYFSGVNIIIATKAEDENNLSREEPWKKKKEVLVFLDDGSTIKADQEYTMATINKIGEGPNSSLGKVLNNIHYKNKTIFPQNYRDMIANEMKTLKSFESVINKYQNNPRVIFQTH